MSRRRQEDTVQFNARILVELDDKLRSRAWGRGFKSAARYAEHLMLRAIELEETEEKEAGNEATTFRGNAPLDIRDIV